MLRDAVRSPSPGVRQFAVRALGRLERSSLIEDIAAALNDSNPEVRATAVQAIGQAALRGGDGAARTVLLEHLESGPGDDVRAKIAETLGRLTPTNVEEAGSTARLLAGMTYARGDTTRDAPVATLTGVARGFFFLTRRPTAAGAIDPRVAARLRHLIVYERMPSRADSGAARRREISSLAAAALVASGVATPKDVEDILADPDPAVREKAIAGLTVIADSAVLRRLLASALADSAPIVRFRAVGFHARRLRQADGCGPLVAAGRDADTHVALAAIDALRTCASDAAAVTLLDSLAASGPAPDAWHRPAHAIVALATAAPARARALAQPFRTNANGFVRTYAARAARALADTAALRRLARDRDPNARAEAIDALAAIVNHGDDSLYVAALGSNDSQVLMSASKALTGNRRAEAVRALLRALDRVTSLRRETSRDARLALLDAIRRDADSLAAGRVAPYLQDFDPAVATRAAEVLLSWVGNRARTVPRPLPPPRFMSVDSLLALREKRVTIDMQDGGQIVVRLFPLDAPTNVARFVRLAQRGYFDGLTFHRVVPYYVVQGGSPRANEYVGDGPFTRDEIGIENRRGTIGLSTRGRDTGDGQIYFNLVDNVQLDTDYTVFAVVESGMDVVDRMQEGAKIRRIRVSR